MTEAEKNLEAVADIKRRLGCGELTQGKFSTAPKNYKKSLIKCLQFLRGYNTIEL